MRKADLRMVQRISDEELPKASEAIRQQIEAARAREQKASNG